MKFHLLIASRSTDKRGHMDHRHRNTFAKDCYDAYLAARATLHAIDDQAYTTYFLVYTHMVVHQAASVLVMGLSHISELKWSYRPLSDAVS